MHTHNSNTFALPLQSDTSQYPKYLLFTPSYVRITEMLLDLCHFPTGTFTPRQIPHNVRMNSLQLYQPFAQTNASQFSFVPHTVSLWNSLHPETVDGSYS